MEILNLLNHECTNLPLNQPDNVSFKKFVKDVLQGFLDVLNDVDDYGLLINDQKVDIREYKANIRILCDGLCQTIEDYYTGAPHKAYESLKQAIENSQIRNFLDKDFFFEEGKDFYRIRNFNGGFALSKRELFHIPFEKRGIVKTQRFSIPGLPSLYLSNSIYVAWEEMKRPDFDSLQAIRLVNKKQINLLDIRTDVYNPELDIESFKNSNVMHDWDLLYKVLTWPLVACCSIKVRNSEDNFKPEYIIPQLLLQWINKSKLDGIIYSSTHINPPDGKLDSLLYNLVLPVKSFPDSGCCADLSSLFEMTEVLPMQLRQFSTNSDRLANQASIYRSINPEIDEIELIRGVRQPYMTTAFGILEHSLKGMQIGSLADD